LQWAGSPGAALDADCRVLLAYRLRYREGASTVVARSDDGERFETLATLRDEQFGAMSMERPALVRTETGRWRLYVCCATQGSSTGGSPRSTPTILPTSGPPSLGPSSRATSRRA